MSRIGAALSACAGRSVEQEVAWQLFLEWRDANPEGVATAGPALPPAILEARVDANVALGPCDLGVCYDPLYATYVGNVAVVPTVSVDPDVAPEPPVALLLQDAEDVAVVRPYSGQCREHDACLDHGVVLDFDGHSYVHHECENGSREPAPLPAALAARLAEPPDKLIDIITHAGTHRLVTLNDESDAGFYTTTSTPIYAKHAGGKVGVGTGTISHRLFKRLSRAWPHLVLPPEYDIVGPGRAELFGESVVGRGRIRGRSSAGSGTKDSPRTAGFDCSNLFGDGYFYGTKRQLNRLNARRCGHGASYDVGCCRDPDVPD